MPPVLQTERDLSGVEADLDRAERLASLLTLSSEAMLGWHLDEGIEFWNTGASGFIALRRKKQWGALATFSFKQNSRSH